jgi:hypothetical protein
MATRNASFKPVVGRKIYIWENSVSGVKTADVNLFRRWQLNLTAGSENLDPPHSAAVSLRRVPGFAVPSMGHLGRQILIRDRLGAERPSGG